MKCHGGAAQSAGIALLLSKGVTKSVVLVRKGLTEVDCSRFWHFRVECDDADIPMVQYLALLVRSPVCWRDRDSSGHPKRYRPCIEI